MITFEIDGDTVTVPPGTTVLDAARALGNPIPTLCFDERQAPFGACRVCLVGIEGAPGPVASCTMLVREGMKVDTQDATARRVATAVVELVLSELPHPPAPRSRRSASTSARPRSAPAASAWWRSRARPARSPPARRSSARG